eukprot:724952-Pyramimonas_sp.AAC.1
MHPSSRRRRGIRSTWACHATQPSNRNVARPMRGAGSQPAPRSSGTDKGDLRQPSSCCPAWTAFQRSRRPSGCQGCRRAS